MAYLSPTALRNLKLHSYKAVDEYVHFNPHQLLILTTLKVSCIPIHTRPLLELVLYSLAPNRRAEHGTLSTQSFMTGTTDIQHRSLFLGSL